MVLEGDLKTLGPEHPKVAIIWNNLGLVWHHKEDHDKAIDYFEKALQIDFKNFSPAHPQVAIRWNNMGSAWIDKGDYDKAIDYFEKALVVFKKAKLPHRISMVEKNIRKARKAKSKGKH